MAEKKNRPQNPGKAPAPQQKATTLHLEEGKYGPTSDMTQSQMNAALATRSILSSFSLKDYAGMNKDEIDVCDLITELRKAGDEVVSGDLGRVERMLTNQFITLDAIFNNLAQKSNRQEYLKNMEVYLRLALKAQAQARATAEAIALLKNPQPYIKQANIAQGPQQVNNSFANSSGNPGMLANNPSEPFRNSIARAGAGDSHFARSKLLEAE